MPYKSQLTLGGRVGGGQFGDVYEGHDQVHGKVAVKVLKMKTGESTADWAARSTALLEEAQHLKAATHPNIVQVHNIVRDSTNDVLHLVTEFCDGGSIDTPYQNGPLILPHVRKIITGACRGLEHIHSRGMIHRDIKPGNILKHGNTYKIGDFGLVSENLVLGYASAGGYIYHLAPEVFDDPATGVPGLTSAKTDIWALGMTVYRLLNGNGFCMRTIRGKTPAEARDLIIRGGLAHSLAWLPHIPEPWRKFVRKAMHDETTQRFQSALAMGQALAKLPTAPSWVCQFTPAETSWTLNDGSRTVTVSWKTHSPRRREWHAVRTGGGKRDLSVGGQPGKIIPPSQAQAELEDFFANWA